MKPIFVKLLVLRGMFWSNQLKPPKIYDIYNHNHNFTKKVLYFPMWNFVCLQKML